MELNERRVMLLGGIAILGGIGGVLADLFSAWSGAPNTMATAISIDTESIKGLFIDKPRWSLILGNYLGVLFIPLHMAGFYLIHHALKPAGQYKSYIFLASSFYLVAIGGGFHGTLGFIGDAIQSGNDELLNNMLSYWQGWGALMIVGYLGISLFLFILIVAGNTMYSRKTALLSPLALLVISTMIVTVLPEEFHGTRKFFAVTGLNLPLLAFHVVTLITLSGKSRRTNETS